MSEQVADESANTPPPAPRYVVVSDSHGLVGWARRLALNGAHVSCYTTRPAYRHCWQGIMDVQLAPKGERPSAWGTVGDEIGTGLATLLTDSRRVTETFTGCPHVLGVGPSSLEGEPVLGVAVWWDGHTAVGHSLAVLEWGAWTGGRGPRVLGAATLTPVPLTSAAQTLANFANDALVTAPQGWHGLALVGLAPAGGGRFRTCGALLGWPALVHDLWLWRAEVGGGDPLGELSSPGAVPLYVGVPISLPPWPHYPGAANRASEPVQLKVGEAAQHVAWRDVRLEGGELVGGGADGLVGVAVGHGYTLTRARRHALAAAGAFTASVFQWRSDAGATSEEALFGLDVLGVYR